MKKVRIFLASSNELATERQKFEIQIYRKCKAWFDKDIFLSLDVWEDLSERMYVGGSQGTYNQLVQQADMFVLLAFNKLGMYTSQEFESAFGNFNAVQKPFIFTYFKANTTSEDEGLLSFQDRLFSLGHYINYFNDSNELWNMFNKELDRLEVDGFARNDKLENDPAIGLKLQHTIVSGSVTGTNVILNSGNLNNQEADKIYNIGVIDKADFS